MEPPSAGWHSSGAVDRSTNGPWGPVAVATEMHSSPHSRPRRPRSREVAPTDRRHRGGPRVVRFGPGGQARERVPDRRPVHEVGGLDDLDVPGHRVGRIGEIALSHHDDVGVGEVERVDRTGGGPTIEHAAGSRDRRDVLGGSCVVVGRDPSQGLLDASETRLEGVDAGALEERVHRGGGERRVGGRQLVERRLDRRQQGVALAGGECGRIEGDGDLMAQRGEMCVGRSERRLLVRARSAPGHRSIRPPPGGRPRARSWRRRPICPAGAPGCQPLDAAAAEQLEETACSAAMACDCEPTARAFRACSTPPRHVCREVIWEACCETCASSVARAA